MTNKSKSEENQLEQVTLKKRLLDIASRKVNLDAELSSTTIDRLTYVLDQMK